MPERVPKELANEIGCTRHSVFWVDGDHLNRGVLRVLHIVLGLLLKLLLLLGVTRS